MCAWYFFSALGFYPVCPGDTSYVIGTPLFDKVTLSLANNKTFTVKAMNYGPQRPYIRRAGLNGQAFNKTFISHSDIVGGGELVFEMDSAPNYKWGTSPESRPPATMLQFK